MTSVYFGGASGISPSNPVTATEGIGDGYTTLASAGDMNGDGFADLVEATNDEIVLILGGPLGVFAAPLRRSKPPGTSGRTSSVAAAGDVDGDGYADVIAGLRLNELDEAVEVEDPAFVRVFVFRGGPSGFAAGDPSPIPTPSAVARRDTFGWRGMTIGDVNADGVGDVGIALLAATGDEPHRAYGYFGTASGLSSNPSATFTPPNADVLYFGGFVLGIGDATGDGFPDVLIGGNARAGIDRGYAFVYSGGTGAPQDSPTQRIELARADTQYGFRALGDVDGDGYTDVLFASRGTDYYLYRGSAAGLVAPGSVTIQQPASLLFDVPHEGAGDLNGDGHDDLVFGLRIEARVLVYYGSSSGFASAPSVTIQGEVGTGFADKVL